MLKVECPSCQAPYQIDERRVPPAGLRMRCPRCGASFMVAQDGSASVAAAPPSPATTRGPSPGAGPGGAAVPPSGAHAVPPGRAPSPSAPAAQEANVNVPGRMMMATMVGVGAPPPLPPRARKPPPPAPRPSRPEPAEALDLPDSVELTSNLPAPVADLPATVADLPAVAADLPALSVDLPVPVASDLPALAAELPARAAGLPAVAVRPMARAAGAMGGGNGGASARSGGRADAPPVTLSPPTGLPLVMPKTAAPDVASGARAKAAAPFEPNGSNAAAETMQGIAPPSLFSDFGDLDLPSELPGEPTEEVQHARFSGAGDGKFELGSSTAPPAPSLAPPRAPRQSPPAAQPGPASSASAGGVGFGELDLGGLLDSTVTTSTADAPPAHASVAAAGGAGASLGLPDLGGATDAVAADRASATGLRLSVDSVPQQPVASEPDLVLAATPTKPREKARQAQAVVAERSEAATRKRQRSKRVRHVVLGSIAAIVLGGGALQLTPLGAFGYRAIGDRMHATEYAARAGEGMAAAARTMASDQFADARQATEAIHALAKQMPRFEPIGHYDAFLTLVTALRFGKDGLNLGSATVHVEDAPADATEVPYFLAARAAHEGLKAPAAAGESFDRALQSERDARVRAELEFAYGESLLRAGDPKAAIGHYDAAAAADGAQMTVRAAFGRARAYLELGALGDARGQAELVRKGNEGHLMAAVVLADIAFRTTNDYAAALATLDPILDRARAQGSLSKLELASLLAVRGRAQLARGALSEARASFDEAMQLDPTARSAVVGFGEVLFREGRFTEALARFDAALASAPKNVDAVVGSAKTKLSLGRLQEAKAQLTAARSFHPRAWSVPFWLAQVEAALGAASAAEKAMLESIALVEPSAPDAALPYVGLSKLLSSAGRTADALEKLEEARKKLPDSPVLRRALGDVASEQGRYADAAGQYRSALALDEQDLGARFRLGVALRRMQDFDGARTAFDAVAAADKEYPGLALERGVLYEASGSIEQALEQFREALAKAPDDPDLQLRAGAVLVSIGQADEALASLKKVIQKRPTSAEAHHYMGRAYLLQGGAALVDAMRELRRAVELDPNRAEYHLYVARAANETSPWQGNAARDAVDKALALDRSLAEGYWQRGIVALRQRAIVDAQRDLDRALSLNPSLAEVHATYAELAEVKNDVRGAIGHWAKAMNAQRVRPVWRFEYGSLLLENRQHAEAIKQLKLALEGVKDSTPAPWTVRAHFALGEAYRKAGNGKAAADSYRAYLEVAPQNAPERKDALTALRALGGG